MNPWGDEVPLGFPWLGEDVERKLVLCVSVQAQGSLACDFMHRVHGKAPTAPNISSWSPDLYQRRSQLKPHASLCPLSAWGITHREHFLLNAFDHF